MSFIRSKENNWNTYFGLKSDPKYRIRKKNKKKGNVKELFFHHGEIKEKRNQNDVIEFPSKYRITKIFSQLKPTHLAAWESLHCRYKAAAAQTLKNIFF